MYTLRPVELDFIATAPPRLVGGVTFYETVLAEVWSILGADGGTRVVWTVAVDARLPVRLGLKAMRPVVAVGAKRALAGLDRQLARIRSGL